MKALRFFLVVLACASVGFLAAACVDPPQVVQGTVVKFEPASQTLVVKDEQQPEQELVFSLQGTEIGAEPAEQDEVRIAYREKEGKLTAIRLMNLTRQKELSGQK